MARYDMFKQLRELTSLHETKNGFSKFIQKGDIEFYDYGVGFFDVSVYYYRDHLGRHNVRIFLDTIDDGDYGGWLRKVREKDARETVKLIAENVFRNMVSLPSLQELNEKLDPYGIQVGYE